jgi:hypothetical protein
MRMGDIKRIRLDADVDLRRVVENVHRDKEPRLIERDGEVLAMVIDPRDFREGPTEPKNKRLKDSLLG